MQPGIHLVLEFFDAVLSFGNFECGVGFKLGEDLFHLCMESLERVSSFHQMNERRDQIDREGDRKNDQK